MWMQITWVRIKLFCNSGQNQEGYRHSRPLAISSYNSRQWRAQPFEVSIELREITTTTQSILSKRKSDSLNFKDFRWSVYKARQL